MGDNRQAAQLLHEALELRQQVDRGVASHVSVKAELLSKTRRAVDMTTDPDILILAANLVQPYRTVDSSAKRLMNDARKKADRLGGPSELLEQSGAAESDRYNRRLV